MRKSRLYLALTAVPVALFGAAIATAPLHLADKFMAAGFLAFFAAIAVGMILSEHPW